VTEPAEEKFLTPGDAARALGVGTLTLKNWEAAGKIRVKRRANNHRAYLAADVERIRLEREGGKL
jgi:DNA-binding transcriptional MerR regulator